MNKVITINLGGNAYQLEEGGYDTLRAYLETATARLLGNPDRDEILADIEQAIAEKFRALLGSHKTVVVAGEVSAVLAEMGPIEADAGSNPAGAGAAKEPGATEQERTANRGTAPRRLYRIHEGSEISGVCTGIAAYFNLDPTLVRLAFVLLTIFGGVGIGIYVVMVIVVPEARSSEEKAAAAGDPLTAQEFIRRAKEGYYEAMKGFPDRQARREWKRRFKREMRSMGENWRHGWYNQWPEPHAPAHPGMGFALPLLSLLQGITTIVCICALISLLATGAVFGLVLPVNVPVWAAALVLLIVFGVIAGPLKAARNVCYWSLRKPGWGWSAVFLLDAVVWLMTVIILFWLALHYFPELRDAVQGIPATCHQAIDDIRNWWHKK